MFFLLIAIFILILITLILILSTIEIKIEDLNLCIPKIEDRIINNNYKISIIIKIFKKLKIFKLDITKTKLEKLQKRNRIKDLEQKLLKNRKKFDIKLIKLLKTLKIQIKKLDLQVNIGTEDAAITSYLIGILSSMLAILFRNQIKDSNKQKFNVTPIYINKNLLNIRLDSIFEIEMIHIIYIIYILLKKGRERKYDRTSNRRSYDYSYE